MTTILFGFFGRNLPQSGKAEIPRAKANPIILLAPTLQQSLQLIEGVAGAVR